MIVMIFAAGLGTRMKPITDHLPKALIPIDGKPLLQIQIDRLYEEGIRTIIVNVHHFGDMIIDFLNHYHKEGLNIIISDEREKLLNTGGGLKKAGEILRNRGVTEPILIHNVDILENANLGLLYEQIHSDADAVLLVNQRKTNRYLLFNEDFRLVGWTNIETGEIKTPYPNLDIASCRQLAFTGLHIVGQQIFDYMKLFPDEFSIIDFYISQCKNLCIKGYIQENLRMMDVGKFRELEHAEIFYKENYKQINE